MDKEFDCVKNQREARARIAKEISGMTTEEKLNYFKSKTPSWIKRKRKSRIKLQRTS